MDTTPGTESNTSLSFQVGAVIDGRFEIVSCLGEGSRSAVYLVRSLQNPTEHFALKVLAEGVSEADNAKFQKEANSLVGIRHENILTCFEQFEVEGRAALLLEHAAGGTLKDHIASKAPLAIDEAVRIAAEICAGLESFHQVGIVHRDLKQRNIFLNGDHSARIGDLGLCKFPGEEEEVKVGSVIGAIDYVSPEYVQSGTLDHRADLYAVSILLYEMLSGEYPFKREADPVQSLMKRLTGTPLPLENFRAGCPREVREIIKRGLSSNPADRFQSAAEMEEALRAADTEEKVSLQSSPLSQEVPGEQAEELPPLSAKLSGGKLTQSPRVSLHQESGGEPSLFGAGVEHPQSRQSQVTKIAVVVCALLTLGGIVLLFLPSETPESELAPVSEPVVEEVQGAEAGVFDSEEVPLDEVDSAPLDTREIGASAGQLEEAPASLDETIPEGTQEPEGVIEPSEKDIKSILGSLTGKVIEEENSGAAEGVEVHTPSAPKPIFPGKAKRKIDLTEKGGVVMLYRVKDGDTLDGIAKKFGVSIEAIAKKNKIAKPSRLSVGKTLRIPNQ